MAAKRSGPFPWGNLERPLRPWFVVERAALERLALLDPLSSDEKARLAELRASKLAESPFSVIDIADLLAEYRDNEVRADTAYKGKVVQFNGVVKNTRRGAIGGITVSLGTRDSFEHPDVTCFFDDSQTASVSALSRDDRVTVRGRVDALVIDVLVKDCELQH
jgi:hypothetical protein